MVPLIMSSSFGLPTTASVGVIEEIDGVSTQSQQEKPDKVDAIATYTSNAV